MEFEWKIFKGFTTLQILAEIQEMMYEMQCEPEQFTGRIISDLDQKIKWYGSKTRTSRMENGMMSLNRCCSTSVKADIPYSVEYVLWNDELCEAKEVENCLYTTVVTPKLLKWLFALLFSSISSVFTER